MKTAVLFLVFNRPDTTAKVFDAIRTARPPRLYIACDGARPGRIEEAEKVASVREISTNVDWPCEVRTLFRDKNLGCKYAVSSAISWFFGLEEEGVILEDDCLPSQSFFSFCEEMLCRYRDEQRVMAVTGTNITCKMHFDGDYFFSRYALMWGWASWASAWEAYDLELDHWPKNKQIRHLKMLGVVKLAECIAWKQILTRTKAKLVDTWDYQWIYSCWLRGGLTIAPAKNLITNIGYSSDATHTTGYHPILSNLPLDDLCSSFEIQPEIKPHSRADAFIARHWFGVNKKFVAKYILAGIPGVKKINQFRKCYFEKRN